MQRIGLTAVVLLLAAGALYAGQTAAGPVIHPAWASVKSFGIQLQNCQPDVLARSPFQMIVMETTRDGTDDAAYTPDEIRSIGSGNKKGAKLVLGYLSVGEAENYRSYWLKDWKAHPPAWIGPENPEWKGNFKVHFWEPPWRSLLEKSIDRMIDQGFDGAFLDVVDAGEFWADSERGSARRPDAEREMVDLVKSLAAYAHRRNPAFGIFPNGAEHLGRFDDYVATIDGLFREDIWYNGNRPNKPPEINEALQALSSFQKAHKPVFAIDYVTKPPLIDDFYAKAKTAGMVPYSSVRDLNKLVINPGYDE